MIDISESIQIAEDRFPLGPESIAAELGVEIQRNPLGGRDGWCVRHGNNAIIQINSSAPEVRQRFTLSHELAHLILGTKPDILPNLNAGYTVATRENEKAVNALASELLLPKKHLTRLVGKIPVDILTIRKIAKQARISETVVARRIADLSDTLGMNDACFIEFLNGVYSSNWTKTLRLSGDSAQRLMKGAIQEVPAPYREDRGNGTMFVALLLEGQSEKSYLLVQQISSDMGLQKSSGEFIKDFERQIFDNDPKFRSQLQGCFGAFKPAAAKLSANEAVELFYERYSMRWTGLRSENMHSLEGREYVRLRLSMYSTSG